MSISSFHFLVIRKKIKEYKTTKYYLSLWNVEEIVSPKVTHTASYSYVIMTLHVSINLFSNTFKPFQSQLKPCMSSLTSRQRCRHCEASVTSALFLTLKRPHSTCTLPASPLKAPPAPALPSPPVNKVTVLHLLGQKVLQPSPLHHLFGCVQILLT